MDWNNVKLNLERVLPSPEEHEALCLEACAREVAEQIRNRMRVNERYLMIYDPHPEIIPTLVKLGYKVQPTNRDVGQKIEYKVEW